MKKIVYSALAVGVIIAAGLNLRLNSQNGLSPSSVFVQTLEALSGEDECCPIINRWTANKMKCDNGGGKYIVCNVNGTGDQCSPGGSASCTCGFNCPS
jgi:hypothetical protein